jgi:hypothetical protein
VSEDFAIKDIHTLLDAERVLATLMVWNRLEGQPRTRNFLRALRAEVRDPLWLLSRQWQTGEFKGDDAGSPVLAKAHLTTRPLQGYRPGDGPDQDFAPEVPLEATVEKRRIPFLTQESLLSLDLRVSLGRHWLRLLRRATLDVLLPEFLGAYGIAEPDPALAADATATAHAETWQQLAALAGRVVDGGALYLYLKGDAAHRASDGIANIPPGRDGDLDDLGDDLVAWFERLLLQPAQGENEAWQSSRLEYRFAVSAPAEGGQTVLSADEYFHGRLDWYSLDLDPAAAAIEPAPPAVPPPVPPAMPQGHTLAFFPANIRFEGMPNTRWWSFEDGKTNFGDIAPDTTDLSKLLLMEFGLVYANDWFLVPFALPVGTLAKVAGVAVTNVFGERSWVQAAGSGADEDWQRWALFNLATKGEADVAADTTLALLPALAKTSEGAPLEDLYLVRDEISNMVWGIEKAIPLPSGWPKAGREAATEMAERQRQILAAAIAGGLPVPTPPEPAANIRYQLMTAVPENWIPFIPVHVPGSSRQIRLQRASMPRIIPGDPRPPAKIKPRTTLLRQGLDEPTPQPLYIEEEEVSRAGERVLLAYQRTRWYGGRVVTWLGARKQVGRGEGSSGLAFDRVVPTRAPGGG